MERLTRSLGLTSRVEFLGRVPHEDMPALFRRSDAFLFTSLRDSFGSVVLEAMAHGLPIVTLNHQGMRAFVPEGASIKVQVRTSKQIIRDFAVAIEALVSNPAVLRKMSDAACAFANQQTWTHRAEMMNEIYVDLMSGSDDRAKELIRGVTARESYER
jgi:glycosyltransferase involved in cell wall biosynthesis